MALIAAASALVLGAVASPAFGATIHVTNLNDSGPGSLRQAIASAPPASTIVVPTGTIRLTSTELDITKTLEIDGAGSGSTMINGSDAHAVFSLAGAAGVKIARLAIVHGHLGVPGGLAKGAAVSVDPASSLTLNSVRVTDNVADASGDATHLPGAVEGGAIANAGTLALDQSAVDHNTSRADGGAANHNGGIVQGAAIYNGGTLSVAGTSISQNIASAVGDGSGGGGIVEGAGVYNPTVSLDISDGVLNSNLARADGGPTGHGGIVEGGAVYNDGMDLTLTNTSASENTATGVGNGTANGGSIEGAGIYNNGQDLALTDVAANGNVARADGGSAGGTGEVVLGGGIYHDGNGLTITGTSVSDTTTSSTGGSGAKGGVVDGGGLYDNAQTPYTASITSSRLGNNSATVDGGSNAAGGVVIGAGAYLNATQNTVAATTVDGNHGTARGQGSGAGGVAFGGAIASENPAAYTNVTVADSSADASGGASGTGGTAYGGGIFGANAITLLNATIANDSVRAGGATAGTARGGDLMHGGSPTSVKNTIVSGGEGDAGYENCREPLTSAGHNIDSLNQCGFTAGGDHVNTNPLLAPLRNNGGPVPTIGLLPHSPAFNAGDNSGCPSTDARGAPRPAFGICDIGAFEVQPAPVISGLKVKPKRFRAKNKGLTIAAKHKHKRGPRGTTVSYDDSLAALTTFTVDRVSPGERRGKRCVKLPKKRQKHKHLKRCARLVQVGTFIHQDAAGPNHFHFSGRLGGRKLAPGTYKLIATPSLWAVTGGARTVRFKIVG